MQFKGSLPLMVLYVLSQQPNHGYAIAQQIKEKSDEVFDVKAGSLYPALHSLEKQGLVESYTTEENGRELRCYTLTDLGKGELDAALAAWAQHVTAVNLVLKGNEG